MYMKQNFAGKIRGKSSGFPDKSFRKWPQKDFNQFIQYNITGKLCR